MFISFHSGWTWFSYNLQVASTDMNAVLATIGPSDNDYCKSQTKFASYYGAYAVWYGSLSSILPTKSYKCRLASSAVLALTGTPIAIGNSTTIPLEAGWTWLPYLRQVGGTLNAVMPSHSSGTYANGDYIKSQTQFSTFYPGYGWYGSLLYMYPGEGYMLRVAVAGTAVYVE